MDLDNLAEVCELSKYPAVGGPVAMALSDSGELVACGNVANFGDKECYSFDGTTWKPLPPFHEDHDPYAYWTRSIFMEKGFWVGGDDGSDGMVNELFTSEGQWITLPVYSPYENINYPEPCIVPLNSTHIFLSGGYKTGDYLIDAWILDLENLVWVPSTPMLKPRYRHGCVLTEDGEVMVAGGKGGESSVHTFNPLSMEWRESGELPSVAWTLVPSLLLWNDKIIFMEYETDNIWVREEDQGWRLMDASMGAIFSSSYDNAVIVPDSWREGCP